MFLKCLGSYIYQSDDHFSGGSRTTCGFHDFVCLQHATVMVNSPVQVSKNWLGLASRRWFVAWKLRQRINADSKQVVRQRHNYAVAINPPSKKPLLSIELGRLPWHSWTAQISVCRNTVVLNVLHLSSIAITAFPSPGLTFKMERVVPGFYQAHCRESKSEWS